MQNIPAKSFFISFRIWILAVLLNTLIGTIVMSGPGVGDLGLIAIFGAGFAAVFSLPVLFILFGLLYFLAQRGVRFNMSFALIMVTGVTYGYIAISFFMGRFDSIGLPFSWLHLVAMFSAMSAILLQYGPIKNLFRKNNLIDELLKNEDNETSMV